MTKSVRRAWVSAKGVNLLRRVQKIIVDKPDRYEQAAWCGPYDTKECGSACCIGGWVEVLVKHKQTYDEALGLRNQGNDTSLFTAWPEETWPTRFRERWRNAKTNAGRARVAVSRINYFIRTGV